MDIIFDKGPLYGGSAFARPHDVLVAHQMDEVPAVLAGMEAARSAGHWLAGMASYELGYMFSNKLRDLMPDGRRLPLLQFGVFDAPQACDGPTPMGTTPPIRLWGRDCGRCSHQGWSIASLRRVKHPKLQQRQPPPVWHQITQLV